MGKQTINPGHAKELGFTIDETCYPWVAYKGPRFQPVELRYCFTDLESKLLDQISNASHFSDVLEFNEKFDLMINNQPAHLTKRKLKERVEFIMEELIELSKSCGLEIWADPSGVLVRPTNEKQDLAEQADALVDIVYVALGTAVMMGLPWKQLWDDVHRANMAKVRGVGKRGHLVDCIKPPGWVGPKTLDILENAGYIGAIHSQESHHRDDVQQTDNL